MKQRVLVYKCTTCGRTHKAHIYGDFYEVKTLYCSFDGSCMVVAQQILNIETREKNATRKTTRIKVH